MSESERDSAGDTALGVFYLFACDYRFPNNVRRSGMVLCMNARGQSEPV